MQGKLGKLEWFAMASSHLEFAACEEGGLVEALWTRAPGQELSLEESRCASVLSRSRVSRSVQRHLDAACVVSW